MRSRWTTRTLLALLLACASLVAQASAAAFPDSSAAAPSPSNTVTGSSVPSPNSPSAIADASAVAATQNILTVPAGENLQLELITPLNSRTVRRGDRADFSVTNEVVAGDQVAVPRGATVHATVTESHKSGAMKKPQIQLQFNEVVLQDGTIRPLTAELTNADWTHPQGEPHKLGKVARSAGTQAVTGAIMGTIFGGSRGAVQGGIAGAAIGTIGVLMQRGPDIDFPRGMRFEVELMKPLSIPALAASNSQAVSISQAASNSGTSSGAWRAGNRSTRSNTDERPPVIRRREAAPVADSTVTTENTSQDATPAAANSTGVSHQDGVSDRTVASNRTGASSQPDPADRTVFSRRPGVSNSTVPSASTNVASNPGNQRVDGTVAAAVPTNVASNRTMPPASPEPAARNSAGGLQSSAGGYKMKVNVELVVVEATIRDHSGAMVSNLKREDFHLFEDGVEQQISHFSRDELPLAVALVLDRSGSMSPVLSELRRAAYSTLSQLKPEDQVALFAFDSTVERLEDLTTDRQRIADDMASITTGGGTNITDALYQAAIYLGRAAPNRRHAIVLVSDNDITVVGYAGDSDVIRMGLETETSIFSVKVSDESFNPMVGLSIPSFGKGSIPKIAKQTGGEVIDARDPAYVPAAMATVISRLKQRYSLGYASSNPRHDGTFREIEIRVRDTNLKARSEYKIYARRGYYARKEHLASAQMR